MLLFTIFIKKTVPKIRNSLMNNNIDRNEYPIHFYLSNKKKLSDFSKSF